MSATRDGKMWRCQFYYKDWQGVSHKKNKRGFKTKAEAEQWERDFLQQQQRNLDINFENFVQIYYEDMEHRLRENTMRTKKFIIDLKIIPYFKKKNMNEIKASDIRAWQNALMKKGYSETYLKTVNNQLSAIFNYAVRYYDLKDNPCRKAGSIGKSHAGEKEFWTKQEFKQFLVTVENKPETKMAFLLLYWTGMRIGELLALTYNDIDLEKRTISVNKSYQRIEGRDIITPPKTPKSKRIITIPPFLTEELIEAKILASGLSKKDYFVRSCIYNRVCVVGKKELVYQLVEELKIMQTNIREVTEQFEKTEVDLTPEGLEDMRNDCLDMLKAILWVLDGAKYLWQGNTNGEEKSPDSGNC